MRFSIVFLVLIMMLHFTSAQAQRVGDIAPGKVTVSGEVRSLDGVDERSVVCSHAIDATLPGGHSILTMDTLNDIFTRATRFVTYTYMAGTATLPVTGSNSLYLFLGEKFQFSGSATVHGFLFSCALLQVVDPPDTLGVNLWVGSETTGLPSGSSIAFGSFTMDQVDTNRFAPVFTYVPLSSPTTVTGPFVGTVQTRRGTTNDDLFVLFSSLQGDGKGENRACCITLQNSQLVSMDFSRLPLNFSGAPMNIDIMILPVIETTSTGVDNSPPVIAGIELRGVAPQPAADQAFLSLRCEKEMQLEIDILDINGRLMKRAVRRTLSSGEHSLPIQTADLPNGTWLLRISHSKGAFAVPLRVLR